MINLTFDCLDAQPDRRALAPVLLFKLRIAETEGRSIYSIALRCQLRIEPHRRRYSPAEQERLHDLFGDVSRWADTLKPMQFAYATQMVPGFSGSVETDLPVACSYDLEVAASRYFSSLEEGVIPLLLLFSGTVFFKQGDTVNVQQVPWHKEAGYRLPVTVWRDLMDLHFPGAGWLRLHRDTLGALERFKSRRALPTWDDTVQALLKEAGEQE